MQWDRIQHRKKAMILQKPKGKGEDDWRKNVPGHRKQQVPRQP